MGIVFCMIVVIINLFGMKMINISDIKSVEIIPHMDDEYDMSKYEFSGLDDINPEENRCGKFYGPDGEEHIIKYDDAETYKIFNNQATDTVFQFDTGLAKRILSDASEGSGIKNHEMLTLLNAMGHPGPIQMIPQALLNRDDSTNSWKKKLRDIHPILEEVLAPTLGIIVYQEQLTTLWQRLAGFSSTEAQTARKSIAKKKVDEISKIREKWILGATKTIGEKAATDYFDLVMLPFGRYAFNRCLSFSSNLKCQITGAKKTIEEWYNNNELPILNSYDGKNIFQDECVDIHYTGELEVFEIEFDNGHIEKVTGNHKFLCTDGEYHEVREIVEKELDVAEVDVS